MNRKIITAGIVLVVAFQMTVLFAEYLGAVYPLWTGKEIRLKTTPVDPRSLFMGNYALLDYEISTINGKDFTSGKIPRAGEYVYVKLKPGQEGWYVFDGVDPEKPASGTFIRGRLQSGHTSQDIQRVRYGIEAYFASKEKATALEKDLRKGGIAVVMVAGNGKAALKEVVAKQ